MPLLEPVIWAKGTFLNPQYLQAQDRYLEDSLQFQMQALNFRPWGFRTLRVDQQALTSGTLSVAEASGILPDGLLFNIPGSDAPPPPRAVADQFGVDQDTLDVFLAVPHYREKGLNIGGGARETESRYRAEVEMFRDENTGQAEKPVMVARKNFRLLVEGEKLDGHSTLRIGRVKKTPAGMFELERHFLPPLLDLGANDYLVSIVRRLVEILASKSSELSGSRRHRNQSLADFTSSDIASFWLLYSVNGALPVFRHLYESKGQHPEELYAAMLSLAGSLTAFSTKVHPRDLPRYDHDSLGACFTDLDEKLRLLLETVVPSNFVALPLKLLQPSIYAASIDREEYLTNTRMYLAVSADIGAGEIINRTPHLLKLCSADLIEHLVQRALPGVPLTYMPSPPAAIPVKLNYHYFSLSQSGGAWEAIRRARNVAAYVPGEFPNPQLELVILLPQAG